MSQPAAHELVGQSLGAWQVERLLGTGGMGAVYEATAAGRRVALKVLATNLAGDASLRARFVREAAAQQQLDHPNVVPVYETGEVDGVAFIAMEYSPYGSLASRLRLRGPLSERDARVVFEQILLGLGHAHTAGYVHRDIKPDNVLFRPDGQAALADFGIVGELGSEGSGQLTRTGSILGSPAWMSPEACGGKPVDQRSDLYSVGCMFFQAVTGEIVFPAPSLSAMLVAHISNKPEPPSRLAEISEDLDAIILRLLEKKPKDRFPTAEEVLRVMRAGYLDDTIQGTSFRKRYEGMLTAADRALPATMPGRTATPPAAVGTSGRRVPAAREATNRSGRSRPVASAPPTVARVFAAISVVLALVLFAVAWAWQTAEGELARLSRAEPDGDREELANERRRLQRQLDREVARLNVAGQIHRASVEQVKRDVLGTWMPALSSGDLARTVDPEMVESWSEMMDGLDRFSPTVADDPEFRLCRAIVVLLDPHPDPHWALDELDAALARSPNDARLYLARSDALREIPERRDDAIAALDHALTLDPSLAVGWYRRRSFRGKDYESAVADLERAVTADPRVGMFRIQLALTRRDLYEQRVKAGQPGPPELLESATTEANEAVRVDPHDAIVWTWRGVFFQFTGSPQEALDSWDRALELNPSHATAWYHKGVCLSHLNRLPEAIRALSMAAQLAPDSGLHWSNLAAAQMQAGNPELAAEALHRALAIDDSNWATHLQLADAETARGRFDRAIVSITRAIELCPHTSRAGLVARREQLREQQRRR